MAGVDNSRRRINDLLEIEKIILNHVTGRDHREMDRATIIPQHNPLVQTIQALIKEAKEPE